MVIKHRTFFLRNIILFLLVFVFFLPAAKSYAQEEYANPDYEAMSYMLIETGSGQVLAQHDADRRIYPASTTKLMVALLLMEKKGLDGETTVGTEINGLPTGSSLMRIEVGEKISIKDLFYGLMLCSGNDAACTIGTYISGSVNDFMALMNQRAAELGMTNTHFVNPYGAFLNQDEANSVPQDQLGINHYTTASDMAKLVREVSKYPEILEAGNAASYMLAATNRHEEEREIINSNPLIHTLKNHPELDRFYYPDATGLKTGTVNNIVLNGTTISSYGNVVATASRNGLSLAALIFDDESENTFDDYTLRSYQRWELAAELFDYGFENFSWVDPAPYIDTVSLTRPAAQDTNGVSQEGEFEISSKGGAAPEKKLIDSATAQALESGTIKVEQSIEVGDTLQPYVKVGDSVGTVTYTLNGSPVYEADLVVTGRLQGEQSAAPQPEQQTGSPKNDTVTPDWLIWVIIPAAAVGALFAVRQINLYRRRRRRRRRYKIDQ
jgi:D-alanyl-D-alanine carboxypeptidase (penicillin-binding protein 5/6)